MRHLQSIEKMGRDTARGGVKLLNRRIQQTFLSVILGTLLTTASGFYTRSQIANIQNEQAQIKQQLTLLITDRNEFKSSHFVPQVRAKRQLDDVLQSTSNYQGFRGFSRIGVSEGTGTLAGFQVAMPSVIAPRFRHQRERVISAFAAWLPYEGQNPLVDSAVKGLTGASWPSSGGWCQKWVRVSIQGAYGSKFDRYMRASARMTGEAFAKSPFVIDPKRGTQPGDIAYKLYVAQGFGHTGIRGFGNVMLENTSWSGDGNGDARTARTLKEWGKADIWVRLPNVNGAKSQGSMGGFRGGILPHFQRRFNVVEQQHDSQ